VLRRLSGSGQQGRGHGAGEKQGQDFSVFHARFLRFVIWWGFRKPNHTTEGRESRTQSADSFPGRIFRGSVPDGFCRSPFPFHSFPAASPPVQGKG
jgi:hypothetical protein